jgi:hypothetical protein
VKRADFPAPSPGNGVIPKRFTARDLLFLFALLAALLVLLTLPGRARPQTPSPAEAADREAIQKVLTAYSDAWNARDSRALTARLREIAFMEFLLLRALPAELN